MFTGFAITRLNNSLREFILSVMLFRYSTNASEECFGPVNCLLRWYFPREALEISETLWPQGLPHYLRSWRLTKSTRELSARRVHKDLLFCQASFAER